MTRGGGWDAAERRVLLGLAEHDLHDVYRLLHGYGAQDVSHIVRGPDGGRRCDHMFASRSLSPISCRYVPWATGSKD